MAGRIWKSGRSWWLALPSGRIARASCFAEAFAVALGVGNA